MPLRKQGWTTKAVGAARRVLMLFIAAFILYMTMALCQLSPAPPQWFVITGACIAGVFVVFNLATTRGRAIDSCSRRK